jgi:hypothetical protein
MAVDPAANAERGEALKLAIRLLLERLSPAERAVYVLREALDYPFRKIADALGISEANARQVARRARSHLIEQRRGPVESADRDGLLDAFLDAAHTGDMTGLVDLLTEVGGRRSNRCGPKADTSRCRAIHTRATGPTPGPAHLPRNVPHGRQHDTGRSLHRLATTPRSAWS